MTNYELRTLISSGFQPSEQGMRIDTPPLRDEAEIYRAFSPAGQLLIVMPGNPNANRRK